MNREEILKKTVEVIYECVPEMEGTELSEESVINTDTAIDSMGFTMVICRLEGIFGIKIPDRQWTKLLTLGDVISAIEKQLKKQGRLA
ncbi:MAG: acyl carrier protein [Firmicutes bacterium]|nr:acyl carrier protein [Bacillota bacterium]